MGTTSFIGGFVVWMLVIAIPTALAIATIIGLVQLIFYIIKRGRRMVENKEPKTLYGTTAQGVSAGLTYTERTHPLKGMPLKQYEGLLHSGMFFELYPNAAGKYEEDCE